MNKYLIILLLSISSFGLLKAEKAFLIHESGISIKFDFLTNGLLRLRSFVPEGYESKLTYPVMDAVSENEVAIHLSGEDFNAHHGEKITGGALGMRLRFTGKEENITGDHKEMILNYIDDITGLQIKSFYKFSKTSPTIQRFTEVYNSGKEVVNIEYVSSAILHNFNSFSKGSLNDNLLFYIPFNSWKQEGQWQCLKPCQSGLNDNGDFNLNAISASNLGTWSSVKYLPMGFIENKKAGVIWYWQLEHNGSWYWEFSGAASSTASGSNYLYLGGPDEYHHQAPKELKPGDRYQTVPVAVGCVKGGIDEAVAALTHYRREFLLRKNKDNETCPVAFNDYMNCLFGDPTTEKELPLIDAAAKAGAKYYVIDAGWYAGKNENWWESVGLWQPSKDRFTGGIRQLLDKIKEKGMVPGLWLEIEVAGKDSPLKEKPDSWFFTRHGKRVIDHGRYLLDFRNPDVIAHCNAVINRLVNQYGIGYIKMDYNVNGMSGTDANGMPAGQGLLEHNRAVVAWYKQIQDLYPGLVVENCASGGCRMDYAMLSQTQLQSSSDQTDYRKYPAIVVGSLAAVLPEQLLTWSYPLKNGNAREASFNMVNAMVSRILQSGNLAELTKESYEQVKTGLAVYNKEIAPWINSSVPFFPMGFPSMSNEISPVSVGLRSSDRQFIAVWRLMGEKNVYVGMKGIKNIKLIYPTNLGIDIVKKQDGFEISFPDVFMAGIIEIR